MSDINKTIEELTQAISEVKTGNMPYQIGNSLANQAGSLSKLIVRTIEYAIARGEKPDLSIFNVKK
jgi:hypothetical protein